jgi:hypothetical protein
MKRTNYLMLIILALIFLLTGCQGSEEKSENETITIDLGEETNETTSDTLPVFFAKSLNLINMKDGLPISSLYCKNRKTVFNQYIIDEDKVLWGYGTNNYGQLGIGRVDDFEDSYIEPVKIAEDVVLVDASGSGYFAIYLTEDGDLYGMGSNRLGLLGQPYEMRYSDSDYNKVTEPVLLMQDVAYASAGMTSIMALKQDGTVWWWGEYSSLYRTKYNVNIGEYYWKSEEDDENPAKILYNSPKMIMEDCIYAVTGDCHGAAITSTGELYTWGLNILGECGVKVGEDDYVRKPTKVLDDVAMVWVERIDNRGANQEIYDSSMLVTDYGFNVFAQLNDGTFMAVGIDLGNKQKTIEVTGDIFQPSTETYSDSFLPIEVKEYSEEYCRASLMELQWGSSMAEVEEYLSECNIYYGKTLFPVEGTNELVERMITINEDDSYLLQFDENKCLYEIDLQEGGSRNGKFILGMTLEEVQSLLDCELILKPDVSDVYADSQIYRASEPIEDTYYSFVFDNTEEKLITVIESQN